MKLKDVISEVQTAKITAYKPGQSATIATAPGMQTTIDLKLNPMALGKDEQGNLKLTNPTQQGSQQQMPTQPQSAEIKPGAEIKMDTPTSEGAMKDEYTELEQIVRDEDYDKLYHMLSDNGPIGRYLQNQIENITADTGLHPKDDFERIEEILMSRLQKEFGIDDSVHTMSEMRKLAGLTK